MAVTYGFYNSLNKDRMYNAEQMSSIFNGIITDGVFSTIGDALMTVAGTGMQVIVKPGRAWFNSTWTLNDAQLPLDVPAADVSLTRIDAVILEVNSAVATRANSIKILKGTPSANPAKPVLSATEILHQYALAYITVAAGATSITAANIEINVGKTSCPFITSVLQQTDITDLFNQWEAEFTTWFENVQAQLSGNVAANLQRQIDTLESNKVSKSDFESSSVAVESIGLYLSLCGNVNPDMLDAAFGKPDDGLRGIGSALAKFSWFKGDSKDTYPHTLLQTKTSFSSCLADPDAVVDIINTSSIFAIVKSSPYAKALLEQAYPTYIKGALAAVGYTYVSLDQSLSTVSSSVDFLAAVDRTANPTSAWDILLYSMNLYDNMKAKTGYDGMVASKPFLRQMYDKDDFTTKVENDATNFHNAAMKSSILIMKTNVEVNKVLYNNKCFVVHASENMGGGGKSHYSLLQTTKQGGTIYTGDKTTMFKYDSFNAMKVLEPRASLSYGAKIGYIPLA